VIPWLDVPCPTCPAQVGMQCVTAGGVVLVYPHAERVRAAERRGVCPVCLSVEDLDDQGLIADHKVLYGAARRGDDCTGKGQPPEVDR
jgi:hypothetical protein